MEVPSRVVRFRKILSVFVYSLFLLNSLSCSGSRVEGRTPFEDCSISEPGDATLKTELAVSSEADLTGIFPVERVIAGECATPAEDGSFAESYGGVKMEVGILFPSKRKVAGGELPTINHSCYRFRVQDVTSRV